MKNRLIGTLLISTISLALAWHDKADAMNQNEYEAAMDKYMQDIHKNYNQVGTRNYEDGILTHSPSINIKNSVVGTWSSLKPGESYATTQALDEKGVTSDGLTGDARLGTQSVNLYEGKDATNTTTGGTSTESYGSSGLGTTYQFNR
jgi:hypothetical protein